VQCVSPVGEKKRKMALKSLEVIAMYRQIVLVQILQVKIT